jgi:hypothetical protein
MRWSLCALALVACDEDKGAGEGETPTVQTSGSLPACASGDIALDVGAGELAYEPLVEGDILTIVHGPQGGWHIETAGFVQYSAREISILPVIRTEDGQPVTTNSQPEFKALVGYDDATCEGTFFNTRAFVSWADICELEGQTLELTLTVGDITSGRETTAVVRFVAALDPIDVELCAQQ